MKATTELLPGLTTDNIEFVSTNGEDLHMISDGKITPYSEFDDMTMVLLKADMLSNPSAYNLLKKHFDTEDQMIKQYTICRYGALNHTADFGPLGISKDDEYIDFSCRNGHCPFKGEGTICNEILVNGNKITRREIEVLRLIAEGLMDKEIADRMSIEKGTVNRHKQNIVAKTGLSSKVELTRFAIDKNLVQ